MEYFFIHFYGSSILPPSLSYGGTSKLQLLINPSYSPLSVFAQLRRDRPKGSLKQFCQQSKNFILKRIQFTMIIIFGHKCIYLLTVLETVCPEFEQKVHKVNLVQE